MTTARLAGGPVGGVLLDYGLTLVSFVRPVAALQRAHARAARLVGAPQRPELFADIHDRVEAEVSAHAGSGALREIDVPAAYAAAYAQAGRPLSPRQLAEVMRLEQEAWREGLRLAPGALETLGTLRAAGLRVGICSNAPYRPQSLVSQLVHLGVAPLLDSATFSAEVGWRKPAGQLFAAALAALGTPPEATVMVGDAVREDVAGAHAAGLRAIRTREFRDDPDGSATAEAVIDAFRELPRVLGLANGCS